MKKKNKILSIFLILILMVSFVVGIERINADTPNTFSIIAEDNDPDESGTGDEISNNDDIEPGQYIAVSAYFVPGTTSSVSIQLGINYPADILEPEMDGDDPYYEFDNSTTYGGGMWPAQGDKGANKNKTPWSVQSVRDTGTSLRAIITDSTVSKPVVNEGVLIKFYFKVKDDAPAGAVVSFTYDEDFTMMAYDPPIAYEGLTLNVYGEMSNNTALDTLTVKNGTTEYTLSPAFTSGTTTKDFSTVVPNNVSSVDVAATMLDTTGKIASGTGAQALDVGENTLNVIAQAQNGTQEIYKINVYRLNNDASLKLLSLTSVDIGEFNKETTSYTALVPYSTSSTTISATPNDSNGSIESGTGSWNLTNTGTIANDKDIVVRAENCDSKYSSVPGNSCTKKTYSVSVTRTAPSTNNNLKSLKVDGNSVPSFASGTTDYDINTVSNATSSVNISAEVEDTGKATIVSGTGNQTLSVGDNELIIKVKAENGNTKDYKIKVRRLNNDSKLSSLTVTSDPAGTLAPGFSSTFYNYYTYTAPSTASTVSISAVASDTDNGVINTDLSNPFNIDSNPTVNILVTAEDGSTSTYVLKLERAKSTNNNLSSLAVDGYTISPDFDPATTLYSLTVDGTVDTVNISAEVEDTGKAAIVSGTGSKSLSYGSNTVQVRVKAENNTTKDYTITITRNKKNISSLSDLKVDGVIVPNFSETKTEYTLSKVAFTKTSVQVDATAKDIDATISGTGTINLSTGNNSIYVTVTAQDGVAATTYTINIEREKDANAYLSEIKVDGNLIDGYVKTTDSYNLTVTNDKKSLTLAVTPESNLATYIVSGNSGFTTSDDGTYPNVVTITVTAEDGTIKTYTLNVRREKSSNNYLSGISLSKGVLDPVFNKETTSYTVDVDRSVENITITPSLEDSSASYAISGPSDLQIGENTFVINVMSENGTSKSYTVIVRRNPSSNNFLSSLNIDSSLIAGFNKNTNLYTIDVPSTKTSVNITATSEESHATVSGTGTFNLTTGVNTFPIVVKAENNNENTYSVVINKLQSDDNTLSSLAVVQSTLTPSFDPAIESYISNVAYTVTNVDITATASSDAATVSGTGNKDLNTGDNTFEIVVTAENNTTKTYTIVVKRAKNNNAKLSNITISGGFTLTPSFDPDTTTYNVSVPNSASSIDITAFKQDPNAVSVTGVGTVNLNTGFNTINIVVTAENGTTKKTYTLIVERDKSNDASLKELTVDSGTLTPSFSSNTEEYSITVNNEVENLNITAVPTSDAASVVISGNTSLKVGTNKTTITVTAEDGTLKTYEIEILRNPSSNNFLSSLSVKDTNGLEYIETFLQTKLEYNITVENDIDNVDIAAVLDDATSSMTGDGNKSLDIGLNSYEVVVTSAASYKRTYKINIFRKANNNNNLSSLTVNKGTLTPAFNKDTVGYTVNVDSTVDEIEINATSEVTTSTVTGTGTHTLVTGVNSFNIDVQSETGDTKTYVVVVNRAASNVKDLSSLSVSEGTLTPAFNKDVTEYNVSLPNETNSLTITAVAESPVALVEGDGIKAVSVGNNAFEIKVTAEDNSSKIYKINVNRAASSINKLSTLTIDGTLIDGFNPNENSYSLNVENSVKSVDIGATVQDPTSTVTGTGVHNLNSGSNEISIAVTAENGDINTYKININRAKNSNNYLSKLQVADGTLSPEFDKETLSYSISVPYEVTSLNLTTEPEVSTSSIEVDGNSNFERGDNNVDINVIAEDGSIRTYKIVVTRLANVNNFLSSISVTDIDGNAYSLSPVFNKTTLSYKVEIPATLSNVLIDATAESSTVTISGIGTIPITTLPQTQKITATSTSGVDRVYQIEFVKGRSANSKLLSLNVNPGTLDPAFDKDDYAYIVDLGPDATQITISATADESATSLTGTGTFNLSSGRNIFKVIVTAENGSINTYTIFVNVSALPSPSTNNKLSSLTVSEGTLDPAFDPDKKLYTVNLDNSVSSIDINATGDNTITGLGTKTLNEGANVFEVASIDSKGNKNIYRVVVNREFADSSAPINPDLAYLAVDNFDISPEFTSDNTDYSVTVTGVSSVDVIAVPNDPNANVTITGNDNVDNGNITITVTNGSGSKTYNISTSSFLNKLQSNVYTLDAIYANRLPINKNVETIKNEFVNPNEYLKIYDSDGVELSDSELVGTGYTIKLEKDGIIYDSKILIVLGDLNGDAEISVADIILIRQYILETSTLNSSAERAALVNDDEDIDIADLLLIKKAILEGGE